VIRAASLKIDDGPNRLSRQAAAVSDTINARDVGVPSLAAGGAA